MKQKNKHARFQHNPWIDPTNGRRGNRSVRRFAVLLALRAAGGQFELALTLLI
jgi:hypothetical protein